MISTKINKLFSNREKLKCVTDHNCSINIFSLDSYCCNLNGFCCSWFEYIFNFQNYLNKPSVPFRSPTLLTIITLLFFLVILIIFSYCFLMLICYQYKCGLFRKPKLTVLTYYYDRFNYDISSRFISSKKENIRPNFSFNSSSKKSNQYRKKENKNIESNSMSFRTESFSKPLFSKNNISSKLNSKSDNSFLNNSNENFARNDFLDLSSLDIENSIDRVLSTDFIQCGKATFNFYTDEKPPSYFDIIENKKV